MTSILLCTFMTLMSTSLWAMTDIMYEASGVRTVSLTHEQARDRTQGKVPSVMLCHLQSPEVLGLDFDIVGSQTSTSLYYSFLHCDAEWEPDDLMELEYYDGINKVYGADSYAISFSTTVDYVHYHLDIDTRPLKISGNFLLEVRDVSDDHLVLRRPIWMSEDSWGATSCVTRQGGRQILSFSLRWANRKPQNPEDEVKVCVWQNRRTDDMRVLSQPLFIRTDDIVFADSPELVFDGGVEWRWADTRSIHSLTFGQAVIEFHAPYYHFTLPLDKPARIYSFHEDFNGGQWVESQDRVDDAAISSDYAFVHFSLAPADPTLLQTHEFFVIGDATGWTATNSNKLTNNEVEGVASGAIMIKQGLHNYLYVARPRKKRNPPVPSFPAAEGSYADTENDYHIAIYTHLPGDTYDHLVGVRTHNTLKTINAFIK